MGELATKNKISSSQNLKTKVYITEDFTLIEDTTPYNGVYLKLPDGITLKDCLSLSVYIIDGSYSSRSIRSIHLGANYKLYQGEKGVEMGGATYPYSDTYNENTTQIYVTNDIYERVNLNFAECVCMDKS